jgi:TonB family protein
MKPILITIAFVTLSSLAKAQQTDTLQRIFTAVEQNPAPLGGMGKFFEYLQANTRYPDGAFKKRIEGKVFVTFVVEENGSLTDVKILRGVSPDIDAEAIRVVSNAPEWRPGVQNGRPVRVQYSMAINFKLPASPQPIVTSLSISGQPDSLKIFTMVEHMPEFKGGMEKFYDYISQNIRYPAKAIANGISGSVYITFVVERDGSLAFPRISRSVSSEIDAEAIRLIKECPNWTPGTQNGKNARVQYGLFIKFKLPKTDN